MSILQYSSNKMGSKMTSLIKLSLVITCLALGAILATAGKPSSAKTEQQSDLVASGSHMQGQLMEATQNQPIYHSTIDRRSEGAKVGPLRSTGNGMLASGAQPAPVSDLATAAGHHHGHAHGKYYEYREVPKKKTWKFGYKRGNHKHTISRHEHGKAGKKHSQFKTKVKWHDKKSKGKGIHLWDYNHHDKKHGHYG